MPAAPAYNESLIDGHVWQASLPYAIDAFLEGSFASEAREDFLREYTNIMPADVPMVRLTRDTDAPFELVDDRGGLNDYRHFFPDRDFGWGSAVHRQKPSDG